MSFLSFFDSEIRLESHLCPLALEYTISVHGQERENVSVFHIGKKQSNRRRTTQEFGHGCTVNQLLLPLL